MSRVEWIEVVKGMHLLDLAQRRGMHTQRPAGSSPGAILGCSSCGSTTRHTETKDRRGAIGLTANGKGWRCHQCQAGGDGIDLIAYELCGARYRDLGDDQRADVRGACVDMAGGARVSAPGRPRSPRHSTPSIGPSIVSGDQSTANYLDDVSIRTFEANLREVVDAPSTAAYLASRHINAAAVAFIGLAHALPTGGPGSASMPQWAHFGRSSWRKHGYHLILPLKDAAGLTRSFIARNVLGDKRGRIGGAHIPKSVPPRGHARAGLVLACPLATRILETGCKPAWWPDATPLRVVVTEGEMDFLAWATASDGAAAVLGIVSGSWSAEVAARIPDGVTLVIATDSDDEGEVYCSKILKSMEGRSLSIERWEAGEAWAS
jgi:Toprim-like